MERRSASASALGPTPGRQPRCLLRGIITPTHQHRGWSGLVRSGPARFPPPSLRVTRFLPKTTRTTRSTYRPVPHSATTPLSSLNSTPLLQLAPSPHKHRSRPLPTPAHLTRSHSVTPSRRARRPIRSSPPNPPDQAQSKSKRAPASAEPRQDGPQPKQARWTSSGEGKTD